MKLATHAA